MNFVNHKILIDPARKTGRSKQQTNFVKLLKLPILLKSGICGQCSLHICLLQRPVSLCLQRGDSFRQWSKTILPGENSDPYTAQVTEIIRFNGTFALPNKQKVESQNLANVSIKLSQRKTGGKRGHKLKIRLNHKQAYTSLTGDQVKVKLPVTKVKNN